MASATITVTGSEGLERLRSFLDPKLYAKATKGGITYASKAVPPAVAKGISSGYNISSSRVKKDISRVRFADGGQSAVIGFSRRPPTLAQFKPNPGSRQPQPGLGRGLGWGRPVKPGKPLTATIIKGKGRQIIPGAFMATGASANRLVLRRTDNGQLKGVYGPSTGSIFLGNSAIGPKLRADVQTRINEQFIKGYQRVLDSAARGFGK